MYFNPNSLQCEPSRRAKPRPAFAYALIDQESAAVVVHRRTEQGFVREVYEGLAAIIPLREIETELPLAEIYDGVAFSAEAPDEEH